LPESKTIDMEIAKLHNTAELKIPIIVGVLKSMVPLSFFQGIHGDEINGVEIVRQLITKKINKPTKRNHHLYSQLTCLVSLIKVENS
jgi:succinylglutamate desuccinylase